MSMNRDNFRANQPPSKVLHIRNLPPDVAEEEVLELCRPFGRIVRTKVNTGQTKNQAFVEFESVGCAIQMISFFVGNADPPKVRNKSVYLQYSTRQEIGANMGPINTEPTAGTVLLVTMDNIKADVGPTIDTLNMVFSAFGSVSKITMFEKASGLQALVQYADPKQAREAKESLDGRSIPDYLIPNHPGSINMKVSFSQHLDLNIQSQSSRSRDFTNPYLPLAEGTTVAAAAAPAAAVPQAVAATQEAAAPSCVLHCVFHNVQYPPTMEALRTVFSTYGNLVKLIISEEPIGWQAWVQYDTSAAAASAQQYLDGYSMYAGDQNKMALSFANVGDLTVRAITDRTWSAHAHSSSSATLVAPATTPAAVAASKAAAAQQQQQQQAAAGAGASGRVLGPAAGPASKGAAAGAGGPASPAAAAAAHHLPPQRSSPGIRPEPEALAGIDWEIAHERVAKEAAAMLNGPARGPPGARGPPPPPMYGGGGYPPHRGPPAGAYPPPAPYGGYRPPPPPYGYGPY